MDREADDSIYDVLAREAVEDRRRLGVAVVAALALHLVLLLFPVPELHRRTGSAADASPHLFRLQELRFAPPEPPPVVVAATVEPPPDEEVAAGVAVEGDLPPPQQPEFDLLLPDEADRRLLPPQPVTTVLPEVAASAPTGGGVVILRVLLDGEGGVVDVTVLAGPPSLAEAATAALRGWTFLPATLDGVATPVAIGIRFRFPA